jgi:hypothetical protein
MHGSRRWAVAIAIAVISIACFPPARSGHAQGTGGTPAMRSELQSKVDRVRAGMQQMRARGEDPKPVFELMKDVPALIKDGRIEEALARTDRALVIVEPGSEPGTPSAPAPSEPMPSGAPSAPGWRHASREPVLDVLRRPSGLPSDVANAPLTNWNDPSVLKEGDHYTMWASLGRKGGGKDVSIWKLTSRDGLDWRVVGDGPVLEAGGFGAWDSYGVETPAVIRVGGTYHMYYTAYKKAGGHLFTMGHATSPDGDRWTKQGELTSLTKVVGEKDSNPWGWLARAEPTAVYVDGTFWLYFTDVHCRVDGCQGGRPMAERGISLAKSRDGQTFTQVGDAPVLLQSASYPPGEGWEGYSTPWVLHDGASFHLFADVFRVDADDKHYQTRIAHYESADGVHFREVQPDVVRVEGHPWATQSVRAPTVIRDGGRWLLWYAGDSFDQSHPPKDMLGAIRSGRVRMGIGVVEGER